MKRSNKREYVSDEVNNMRLETATIFGFFFGMFGIHDFVAKRYSKGCIHLILSIIGIIMAPFCIFLATMGSDAGYHNMSIESRLLANTIFYAPFLIIAVSYVWAIIESINFLNVVRHRIDTSMLPPPQKEKIKRKKLDYMIVAIVVATLIIVPIVIAFLASTISVLNR